MRKLGIGSVSALAFGLALVLSAAPASAQTLCGLCTCENSCDDLCFDGPFVDGCEECNQSTCGASGPACGGCPPPSSCGETTTCTHNEFGTDGGDTIDGSSEHECIYGKAGDDTISGHAGDDTIFGGSGHDTIYGGSGNDCLLGEAGNDNLTGDTGTDIADGGDGTDTCDAETEVSCEL